MTNRQDIVVCVLLVVVLSIGKCTGSRANKNKTVSILTLLPYPNPLFNLSWSDGPFVSLALDMARDQINNQTELLPDYYIELLHEDSGCELAPKVLLALLKRGYYSDRKILGILGPGCSDAALALARLTSREELALVTLHGAGSHLFSNRAIYPYALSSLGTQDLFSAASVELMRANSWTRVAVLFDESWLFFSHSFQTFIDSAIGDGRSVSFSSPIYEEYIPLSLIIERGLRVVFLFTPRENSQRVLCLAYHRGMVYDIYQWIVIGNFFGDVAKEVSFTFDGEQYYCSELVMKSVALDRVIFLTYRLSQLNESVPTTHSGFSFSEYDQTIREKINVYNSQSVLINRTNISYSFWSAHLYDSLWAWSVALDSLTRKNPSLDLTKIEYGDTAFSDSLMEEFYSLDFEGVSGRIKFLRNSGSAIRSLSMLQVKDNSTTEVAYYNGSFLLLDSIGNISDAFLDDQEKFPLAASVSFLIVTVILLCVIIVLHTLTIKYRHYPSVKASSVKLNQCFYIGCYVFIIALFLFIFNEIYQFHHLDRSLDQVMCNVVSVWLLPISYSLIFGTVAVRTWRLYRIFIHSFHPGRFIGDYYLFGFVIFLVVWDVVVSTVLFIYFPLTIKDVPSFEHSVNKSVIKVRKQICVDEFNLFFPVIFLNKGLLLIAVIVLTVLTRKIKQKSFTTKSFQALVYLFSIIILSRYTLYFFFQDSLFVPTYSLLVMCTLMLFLFIALIPVPPLLSPFREKISLKKPPVGSVR